MTDGDQSISKHAPLLPVHLDEQVSVTQLVQRLETLHFDSHEEARIMIDRPSAINHVATTTASVEMQKNIRNTGCLLANVQRE